MIPPAPVWGLAALTGLVLGSYAVTSALRFTRAEASSVGRSHCDSCGRTLSFAQTVPVFSYIRAKGVCAGCGGRIDPVHLVGELGGALIVMTAALEGATVRAALLGVLGLVLLAASVIDWNSGRLPNVLTGAAAAIALVLAALRSAASLEAGLVAAVLALVVFQTYRSARSKLKGHPGLGFGDVKLMCALALWLGIATPWMMVAAPLLGLAGTSLRGLRKGPISYGPLLAATGWGVGMAGELALWPTTV